jgi:hypothetical protein
MTDFHKRACKNKEFKFKKISKIKADFRVKLKMISIDHYFHPTKHWKMPKNIFQKTFYAETNGVLVTIYYLPRSKISYDFSLLEHSQWLSHFHL